MIKLDSLGSLFTLSDTCCGYLNKFPLKWVSGTNLDSHFRFLKSHSLACEMVRSYHVGRL